MIDDKCPLRIQSLMELQQRISDSAAVYNLTGNVEIDDGFSFTY